MALHFLRINGLTTADRNETISRAREAITQSGGWITDFKLFSNVSLCINFELPPGHVSELCARLEAMSLHLSRESIDQMAGYASPPPEKAGVKEIVGTLQILFIHNEPDLRIEVPAIPG